MKAGKFSNIKIISAGAGSGKTHRLMEEMVALLQKGVRANGIIATTFTNKAAAELQERVRIKLLEKNLRTEADQLTNALIGTVHGLGVKLLKRFAFEAGVSPKIEIIADEDHQLMFNQSLSSVLTRDRMKKMDNYSNRLGLNKKGNYDWRREVKNVTDIARSNDFSPGVMEQSKIRSFETFKEYLGLPKSSGPDLIVRLNKVLSETIISLEDNEEDKTKVTQTAKDTLKAIHKKLSLKGELDWHEYVKLSKLKVGAKSRNLIEELTEVAKDHDHSPLFQDDIRQFIYGVFEISIEAIKEYENYKKRRGLIDYTDMEFKVKQLLEDPKVVSVLQEELDLLMVDEFQDTSPMQLEIFLKLSQLAKYSIWVGDPKQSIYGFRGADPELMKEVIQQTGGIQKKDIQKYSWRSRPAIVHATNAIFCKAFDELESEQVKLIPKRNDTEMRKAVEHFQDPTKFGHALMHLHFQFDSEQKRMPGRPWMENCIARSIKSMLDEGKLIFPKDEKAPRKIRPGDISVLCKTNALCATMAEALHRAGIKAAISRSGLLETAEAKLVLACLKFIISRNDALSTAEILKLGSAHSLKSIVENRLDFLKKVAQKKIKEQFWAIETFHIQRLSELREEVTELSSAEIINLILEELDLRRVIAGWGNKEQRLDNIDQLRQLALTYEDNCNRLHTAATMGGFLLWLNNLKDAEQDHQSSGTGRDAVNVLTYHRSKGLEWPMVICHNLEINLRDKIWGAQIIQENDKVDLNNILGNRWLRYWLNPYSDQYGQTRLEERINHSPIKKTAQKLALQEEARLLYVGITRARDYLVFPTRKNPTKWLNRVWHDGDESVPTLDHYTDESPWVWEGEILKLDTIVSPFPKDFTTIEPPLENISFIEEHSGKKDHLPYAINIERQQFFSDSNTLIHKEWKYSKPFIVKKGENPYYLSKAIQAFLAVKYDTLPKTDQKKLASAILQHFNADDLLNTDDLLQHSHKYQSFIDSNFAPQEIYKKYPVRYHHENRLFEKIIDVVLITSKGLVVIQHSDFTGTGKEKKNKVQSLSPLFYLVQKALRENFELDRIRNFLHFPLNGSLIELEIIQKDLGQTCPSINKT